MGLILNTSTVIRNLSIGPLSGGGNGGGGGGSSIPIETSGLQLFLDAANTTSYSGTGNTWADLSGNGNDFTGGVYSGTSTPTFVSDGDASYFQFQESSGTLFSANSTTPSDYGFGTPHDLTISFWANPNSLTSGVFDDNAIWFKLGYGYTRTQSGTVITGGTQETQFWQMAAAGSNRAQNDIFRLNTFEAGRGLEPNWYNVASDAGNWTNYTLVSEVDSSNGLTFLLYVNGSATSYTETLSYITSTTITSIDRFVIGGNAAGTSSYMWNGKLANFALYNRALSASEVLSNYNALSSRF